MKKRQIKIKNRKIIVHRLIIIFSIILIILILALLIMMSIGKRGAVSNKTGKLGSVGLLSTDQLSGIVTPENCSEGSLKNVWDSIFQESSDGITMNISQSTANGGCSNYLLYKVKNNQELYLLYDYSFYFFINMRMVMGLNLNASSDLINNLTNPNSTVLINNLTQGDFYNLINDRYIDSQSNAVSEFSNKFKITSNSWQYNLSSKIYLFNDSLIGDNLTRIKAGILLENKSLDYLMYITTPAIFQISNINNITRLKNSDWVSAIDLNNVFNGNLKLDYSVYNLSGSNINYTLENYTLKFKPNANFTGSESFRVMAYNGSNYLNSNIFEVKIIINNTSPEFIAGNCNLTRTDWYMNENYSIDVSNCFRDLNGDGLSYRFGLFEDSPLTIVQNRSTLKLIPRLNWFGNDSFYVYASDSINETRGIIYFSIKYSGRTSNITINRTINVTTNQTINPLILNQTVRIMDPAPNGEMVTDFFGKNLTFFVSNTIYDRLEWFLDGKSIKNDSNTVEVRGLSKGNHSVEVRITKGSAIDSKIWKVTIEDDEHSKRFIFDAGWIMFYLILIIVTIIIILVIWLFIEESMNKNKKVGLDLTTSDRSFSNLSLKDDLSKRLNIPK